MAWSDVNASIIIKYLRAQLSLVSVMGFFLYIEEQECIHFFYFKFLSRAEVKSLI